MTAPSFVQDLPETETTQDVAKSVKHLVMLLLQRPITEAIAMEVESYDEFKLLEIENGNWVGLDEHDTSEELMGTQPHGHIAGRLLVFVGWFMMMHNLGRFYPGDTDFVLSGAEDSLRIMRKPDIGVVLANRVQDVPKYFYGAPDIAIEVQSPNQSRAKLRRKLNEFISYGTQEGWLVLPERREIEIHTQEAPIIYKMGETLTSPTLNGFSLELAKLFE